MTEINKELVDTLSKKIKSQADLFGKDGMAKLLIKSLAEKVLEGELTDHLGYDKNDPRGNNSGNSRNGKTEKTVSSEQGELILDIPRDRNGSFEPKLIPKNVSRLPGLDEKILSLYSRGMSTRDIQEQLEDIYGVEISPSLISTVTDSVIDEVKNWQGRGLDAIYPIVYLDAIVVKIKENRQVINKSIYLALGVNMEGHKELLGMWINQTEGSKFWLSVLTELKNRGIKDIFICCVDGLTGFPNAIEAVFPQTRVQLCIVHIMRNCFQYVSHKNRKALAKDMKKIYSASTIELAEAALTDFSELWDKQYPAISKIWLDNWVNIIPFFDYPEDIRKVIYTTNAIESLNMTIRKYIKNKRFFPSDDSAFKQVYLAIQNVSKKWTMPVKDWPSALNRFAIEFENRI